MRVLFGLVTVLGLLASTGGCCCLHETCDCCQDICAGCCSNGGYYTAPGAAGHTTAKPEEIKKLPMPKEGAAPPPAKND